LNLNLKVCDYCKGEANVLGTITVKFDTMPPIDRTAEICVICAMEVNKKLASPPIIKIEAKKEPVYRATRSATEVASGEMPYMGGIGDH